MLDWRNVRFTDTRHKTQCGEVVTRRLSAEELAELDRKYPRKKTR